MKSVREQIRSGTRNGVLDKIEDQIEGQTKWKIIRKVHDQTIWLTKAPVRVQILEKVESAIRDIVKTRL